MVNCVRGVAAVLFCGTAATCLGDVLGPEFQVLARHGQPLVGIPGQTVAFIGAPGVGPNGTVAIHLSGGTAGTSGIFRIEGGTHQLIARQGTQAPGAAPGQNLAGISTGIAVPQTDGVRTAFRASLTGPGVTAANNEGIWWTTEAGLSLRAREGDPATAAGPGVNFGEFWPIAFGAPSTIVTTLVLTGAVNSTNDSAIWRFGNNTSTVIAREGSPAPGTSMVFRTMTEDSIILPRGSVAAARNGAILFSADASATPGEIPTRGIWSYTEATGTNLVALAGSATFDTLNPAITLHQTSRMHLGESGRAVFRCSLTAPFGSGLVSANNDTAIVTANTNAPGAPLHVLLRENDPIPDRPVPYRVHLFHPSAIDPTEFDPRVNASGNIAFVAGLDRPNFANGGTGVFFYNGLSLSTIALSGDAIPDRPGLTLSPDVRVALNDFNDVAFAGGVSGMSGIAGLFVASSGSAITTLALQGDQVLVAPGILKTIDVFSSFALPTWDDNRNLFFGVQFTDGTRGFMSVHVPAPTTVSLVAVGLLTAACRRRRREQNGGGTTAV